MSNKKQQTQQEQQVGTAVTGVEAFLQKYQKHILNAILAILVIIVAIFAINRWYLSPQKAEAKAQMYTAERLFRANDFETALNGDGNIMGFAQIIDKYGKKGGSSVYMYAGISALQLGKNEEAVSYLKKYSGKDEILKARALCCMGDAYANLGETQKSFDTYKKAAAVAENSYAAQYLMKAAIMAEELGKNDEALKLYKDIQIKYPQSYEGYEVNKYISRIENK